MAPKTKAKARKTTGSSSGGRRRSTSRRGTDLVKIVKMLEDDHSKVDKLFKKFEKLKKAEDEARYALVPQICSMLKVHMSLEEELLYPTAHEVMGDDADMVDEAQVEHASGKQLITDLERMDTDEHLFDAKVKVLGEYINHHVEEEEDEFFPKLKKKADDQFDGVFGQMQEMRRTLESGSEMAKTERTKRRQAAQGSAAHS
ncbi:MAG: hemerythrin domain-containing protein [Rhodospirillaceae bacterium]